MAEIKKTVKKAEPAKKETPKKVAPAKNEAAPKEVATEEKKRINRYHISQDPKDKKWRVFLEGSTKVIKKFDTQLQAYGYAQNLSDNNDRGIVVHSKKGKIRKM